MTDQPERLDLGSPDIAAKKIQDLLFLFPEIRTEDSKIDFDRLKSVLGETIDIGKERYGMNWPGKAACFNTIQRPSMATLRPAPEESVNFDTTENLIIEGDNLEVLKLLQKSYLCKIKMIYIDPPYNTGNDFIYPDNFTESLQTYLEYTGQVGTEGKKFGTNMETDGRFHSKWMNMMYPRLYLARNLLREDGVIFISIDDGEIDNLRKICNEVFGEECFAGCVTRVTGTPTGGGNKALVNEIDYVLVYFKAPDVKIEGLPFTEDDAEIYTKNDEDGSYLTRPLRRTGGEDRREDRPTMYFPLLAPDGQKVYPIAPAGYQSRWICGKDRYDELERAGLIEWNKVKKNDHEIWQVYQKFYLEGRLKQPSNLWSELEGNKKATRDLKIMFDGTKIFNFPKPIGLLRQIIQLSADETQSIVLDFFAGSGTTGHAVMAQNVVDGGNRRYILVQLPEQLDIESKVQKIPAEFCDKLGIPRNIAELTKERLRRASKKIREENPMFAGDLGFRVFKLAESNFKPWNAQGAQDAQTLEKQLDSHIDHIREDRSPEDILYEILLKSGFSLTMPVENIILAGKTVYSVAVGAMLICLENQITIELIRSIAEKKPERVVCLDQGFAGNDQLKTNAVQTFKTRGITFRTV